MFTPAQVAQATGILLENCQQTWPQTVAALGWAGIDNGSVEIAAAATIATETPGFLPLREFGDQQYFLGEFHSPYEAQFCGRGVIQLSWSYNYRHYGDLIGVDLLGNPDLALQQDVANKVLALYFREHGVPAMAVAGNWYGIRRAVNGGLNGIDRFLQVVNALLAMPDNAPARVVTRTVTTVATAGALKTLPNHVCPAALGPDHRPVHLAAGQVLLPEPDPHLHIGETPHWRHYALPASGVHGWFLKSSVAEKTVQG